MRINGSDDERIIRKRGVSLLNDKEVKALFCDTYNFYLHFKGKNTEQEYWDRALTEYSALMQKYNGCRMCCQMLIAVWEQLERENGL